VTAPQVPDRLDDLASPGAIAVRELRRITGTVEGDAERFLAAAAIVATAIRQHVDTVDFIALRREAKAQGLLTFSEFDRVAREAREHGADEEDAAGRGPSQATRLVNLATSIYDFGVTHTGEPFAVPRQGGYVARMLRGGRPALRPELASAMFATEGTAPNGSALSDALAVLEGQAQQADPVDLALRTARYDDVLLLDLGDATGRVAAITADGWEVVERSPVLFRRTAATLPLPQPAPGGELDGTLFKLLNIARSDSPLMKAWLVHQLWPDISHVIARLTGRDGTAKTSATRIMRSLIDPCAAPTRATPKDETDWIIAVNAALIAAIDNVSSIPDWLSDAMCRASTGEGLMRRKLYTDQDVSILSARRVVILNGIDATIRRADFARRISDFELQPIAKFKSDSEVAAEWAAMHPAALGALLDLTVSTMKRLPGVELAGDEESLTMTMFARIAKTLSEPALKIYIRRLGSAAADIVDSDLFASRLMKFAAAQRGGRWDGLASDLLAAIPVPDPVPKGWPKDATRLGVWVRRFGRVMESAGGIRITKEERTSEGQPYIVEVISAREITVGNPATSATQQHDGPAASENTATADVAGELAQLHLACPADQQECSNVAGVAALPTSQDRDQSEVAAPGPVLTLLQEQLGAELIEPTANGQPHTRAQANPEPPWCIAPGPTHRARRGTVTCWEHAAEYEPTLTTVTTSRGNP
jgi:hypothetical protein